MNSPIKPYPVPLLPSIEGGAEPGIHHALRVTLKQIQHDYIPPASHSDGRAGYNRTVAPMGLRLRLKSNYDISGFDPVICTNRATRRRSFIVSLGAFLVAISILIIPQESYQ